MKRDPYEVLGVDKTADAQEIRRAYRKAASAAHSDREGGDDRTMQELNDAYELLADEDRRKRFDDIGVVDKTTFDQDAGIEAFRIFSAHVVNEKCADPVMATTADVTTQLRHAMFAIGHLEQKLKLLRKRLRRIRRKDGEQDNWLGKALKDGIQDLEKEIQKQAKRRRVLTRALELLADYEFEPLPPALGYLALPPASAWIRG
jgi:curved DNA-binding protein CbpA